MGLFRRREKTSTAEADREGEAAIGALGVKMKGAILGIDIGSIYTRAVLIDLVDGVYHFVARGQAATTANSPSGDVQEGVLRALREIEASTGRDLLDYEKNLIYPESADNNGVDACVITSSAGQPIRAVLVGLVPDVSLASARRAADSTYMQTVETISLGDTRPQDEQIDSVVNAMPDVIVIVGGTEGGASESIRRQIDTVRIACGLLEAGRKPTVLYAGNSHMQTYVEERIAADASTPLLVAPNLRPALHIERLAGTQKKLGELYHFKKSLRTPGFAELGRWTDEGIQPTAQGFSRTVQVLGQVFNESVLGIDLGSSATTVVASLDGELYLNVFAGLGIGAASTELLQHTRIENVTRWLPTLMDSGQALDYIFNKAVYPHRIPVTREEIALEYAMARELLRAAILQARKGWRGQPEVGPLPPFRTILLSGSTLASPPHPGWSLLTVLDALQPGVRTRILTDPFGLAPALGHMAQISPTAVIQVLETGSFEELSTVLPAPGRTGAGQNIARFTLRFSDGRSSSFQAKGGEISVIDVPYGTEAELHFRSSGGIETGTRNRRLAIRGSSMGLVIDGRGRPRRLPRQPEARLAVLVRWQESLVGKASSAS